MSSRSISDIVCDGLMGATIGLVIGITVNIQTWTFSPDLIIIPVVGFTLVGLIG